MGRGIAFAGNEYGRLILYGISGEHQAAGVLFRVPWKTIEQRSKLNGGFVWLLLPACIPAFLILADRCQGIAGVRPWNVLCKPPDLELRDRRETAAQLLYTAIIFCSPSNTSLKPRQRHA